MNRSLVVTLNGVDRPGLIARVAGVARDGGASWQESRFAQLAGRFAGVVLLEVPEASLPALERTLADLEGPDLHVTLERGPSGPRPERPRLEIDLVGQDRPGIVRDVAAVLARHAVNIEELDTEVESASMSGELLFHARAALLLPENADVEALRNDLERLANELMVDLCLDADSAAARAAASAADSGAEGGAKIAANRAIERNADD